MFRYKKADGRGLSNSVYLYSQHLKSSGYDFVKSKAAKLANFPSAACRMRLR